MKVFKKIVIFILVGVLLTASSCFIFSACTNVSFKKTKADNIYAESYADYASVVNLDVDRYPQVGDQGLYWLTHEGDGADKKIKESKATSSEGAAYIDSKKPTAIIVHGLKMNNGHSRRDMLILNERTTFTPQTFGHNTSKMSYASIWLDKGYNVGIFHYEKFADNAPNYVEASIWSRDVGAFYRDKDGKLSAKSVLNYSLAEYFVAEYTRALRLLPKSFGNNEIRFAGHSMGGVMITASAFLLTELARVKQIPQKWLPDRLAYIDAYMGLPGLSLKNKTIAWSGKPNIRNEFEETYIECFKDISDRGIAIEFYAVLDSYVVDSSNKNLNKIKDYCTYSTIIMDVNSISARPVEDAHGAICEWYLTSIFFEAPKISGGELDGEVASSAKTSTKQLLKLKGKSFFQTKGTQTFRTDDDFFEVTLQPYKTYLDFNNSKS